MTEHPTELIFEYLSDALEPAAKAELEAHLAGCDVCRAEVEERLRFLGKVQVAMSPPRPSDVELLTKVRATHTQRGQARETRARRLRLALWLGLVPIAAAALLVLLLWHPSPPRGELEGPTPNPPAHGPDAGPPPPRSGGG